MLQSNALTIKVSNATTYLVRFLGLYLVPFQSSSRLPFGGAFVQSVVDLVEAYKWVADGLTLAGRMLQVLDLQSCFVTFQLNVTFTTLAYGIRFDSYA